MQYYHVHDDDDGVFLYGHLVVGNSVYVYLVENLCLYIVNSNEDFLALDREFGAAVQHPDSGLTGVFADILKNPEVGGYLPDGRRMTDAEYYVMSGTLRDDEGNTFYKHPEEFDGVWMPSLQTDPYIHVYAFPDGSRVDAVPTADGVYSSAVAS